MSSDHAIRISGLSKHYLIFERPEDRLKQMLVPRLQRLLGVTPKRYFKPFSAVQDVSFEVKRGETVGIIGRNGSGKSTLLQIICGTLLPSAGTVDVNGRIAALLELGAGFNPEFTGRENVFVKASILGLSHAETEARFDDIARFADIGMFIDQPVKTYSSGMFVRLAFATAINVDPDILVVDEALAVGDEAFQRKCYARIEEIKSRGATILFVSHGAQTIVQLCDRALLMDRGELILEGRPKTVVSQYQRLIYSPVERVESIRAEILAHLDYDGFAVTEEAKETDVPSRAVDLTAETFDSALVSHSKIVYPENGALISDVHILNASGERVNTLVHGQNYRYRYHCRILRDMSTTVFSMLLKTMEGLELFAQSSHAYSNGYEAKSGQSLVVTFAFRCLLMPGTYFGNAGVTSGADTCHRIVDAVMFRVAPYTPTRVIMRYVNLALDTDGSTLSQVQLNVAHPDTGVTQL